MCVSVGRVENENEEEEDGSESNSPPVPYKMKPSPEGCCTTDGFCQAGRDLRLSSLLSEPQDMPPGFQLVGALSAGTPDTLLVCAVDRRFLPDERECNALLGFSGNCIGCGEKGFRYFTEFSNHINLKLSTQPKKQKHLKYHLYRNNQGQLVRGAAICWKGLESSGRQTTQPNASDGHVTSDDHFPNPAVTAHPAHTPGNYTASFPLEHIAPPPLGNGSHIPLSQNPLPQTPILSKGAGRPTVIGTLNTGPLKKRHRGWSPAGAESAVKTPLSSSSSSSSLTNWTKPGHGSLPRLSGKVSDVQVSSLLQSCYQNCQALPRVYQHYGPSPIQPLSVEMQILLTVYYLVQLGPDQVLLVEDLEQIFMRSWRESHLSEIRQYQQPQPGLSLPQAPYTLPGLPLPQAQPGLSLPQVPYTLPGLPLPQAQSLTPSQLPWLANLAASSCGEGVVVLGEKVSMALGLSDTFSGLMEGQLAHTNYVVIICTGKGQETESCMVVTGQHQCRALTEGMFSLSDSLREISQQLSSGMTQELTTFCNSLGPEGDVDVLLESAAVENRSQLTSLSISQECTKDSRPVDRQTDRATGIPKEPARDTHTDRAESPKDSCSEYRVEWREVRPIQLVVARKLLSHVCAIADSSTQNLDLSSFDRVHFLNCVPPSEVTFQQTVLHLWNSALKSDLPGLGLSAPSVPHPASVLQPPRTFPDSIAVDPLHPNTTPQGPHRPPNTQRRPSKSISLVSSSPLPPSLLQCCSWPRGVSRPPSLLLPRGLYDIIKARDGSRLPRCTSFLPHRSVTWVSPFRPLLSKMMTCTEQSLYYRQWTIPQPHHMDSSNRPAKGRTDFHPRRLLLSGPPQVYTDIHTRRLLLSGPPQVYTDIHTCRLLLSGPPQVYTGIHTCRLLLSGPPQVYTDIHTCRLLLSGPPQVYTDIHTCRLLLSGPPQVYTDFHPRRLLLSGPPQVGKTGVYLQFLGILSRMLIRLMEVDIYDEEDINFSGQLERVQYQPTCASWPVTDTLRGIPFDYTVHDPKYEDISTIYCPGYYPNTDGIPRRQEDVYLRRRTARIKLSKYAAYNTYHHCEQCHQYTGFDPAYQMYELTLHAFTFSHLLLGEDIQLYFIIPKSKHHHFSFSQPGGQLESMRLPLTSNWNPDCIKSPIFTPTTGRHEHGLFNLYHTMDGAAHLHILVIKEYEMAVYKKYWPNHIMLVLPTIFNGAGLGAAHFLIKELSYNNLELERSRRVEGGGPPADVWPFIILSDDSCVMWNAVDLDSHSTSGPAERNVSLKQMLQHMEACLDLTQFGVCGIRKWSSHSPGQGSGGGARHREPFSRGHLHDFLLLNVDLTQGIQFNQNRFTCDDVDFTLRVHSAGLLICRFNNFSVMKKQISIGGYHTFIIKNKMTDVPTSVQPSQYICAPDSKHPFLATPAQLLLEKYLQHSSLFPLSTCNYTHPILSVDCYLNLGPEVTVCFVSSRPHSINICTTGLLFSGLLLCFWDSFITPGFLKNFHFLKGAVLCVICADRSSLRQTVVRLELEDEWRFRLSDEFQTANAKEDRPLFFLTGKHI
ncbi:protein GREB1-like isoform X2 [Oncorhynchus keta]|uniref:protein GREB1-like isoform X2 n=1 Tax=Oncorhynchus keta TaxID=8018 RepID=UPI00227BD937|nr:protein GREB1-like isoform X2 [Oncorhynchus keta]